MDEKAGFNEKLLGWTPFPSQRVLGFTKRPDQIMNVGSEWGVGRK